MLADEDTRRLFSRYLTEAGQTWKRCQTHLLKWTPLQNRPEQFGIRYYSATPKERHFVEEVTRATWANMQEEKTGVKQDIRPAFSA